ncbi:MAG: hypothetical protein KAJ01_10410 [Candidatus Hydrogenedentes bacterium]|nr:hypothetical protein [Candidatus Hydrogenedentota bacterium]
MLLQGDAARIPLRDGLVQTCVTSPPYWAQRKYKGNDDPGSIGLEPLFDCGAWKEHFPKWRLRFGKDDKVIKYMERPSAIHSVRLCGECHVCRMIAAGREVWRVGRDDFVWWLNYGDCFVNEHLAFCAVTVAKALVADGWMARNDLAWYKRNPMPESVGGWRWEQRKEKVAARGKSAAGADKYENAGAGNPHAARDGYEAEYEYGEGHVLRRGSWRHTKAHEYIFQLVKAPQYYCNQEAVRESALRESQERAARGFKPLLGDEHNAYGDGFLRDGKPHQFRGRNPRSVLDVTTAAYKGAHYATFPPDLIAPLIRASCPRRACPDCGQAWAPVVETRRSIICGNGKHRAGIDQVSDGSDESGFEQNSKWQTEISVTGYRSTCECGRPDHEPGIVLDIFGGSGTTGMVARQLMRRWIVMDISQPYLDEQAKVRTGSGTPARALEGLPMFEGVSGNT